VGDILNNGRRYYHPSKGEAAMPIEFQGACFRVGHTMIRPSYRANLKGDGGKPFFGFIFDPALGDIAPALGKDPADLRNGFRAPRRFIGWQTFFDFNDGEVKHNKQIDTKISTPLFTLPLGAIASHKGPTALMQRNFLRHITWSMASVQAIAGAMGVDRLSAEDLKELKTYGVGLEQNTSLFYYMLKESALVPNTDIGKNTGIPPRAGRRPHRRRGHHRPAADRSELLPRAAPRLDAHAPEPRTELPDDRLPHVRRRRSGDPAGPEARLRVMVPCRT